MARAEDDDDWWIRGIWATPRDKAEGDSDMKVCHLFACVSLLVESHRLLFTRVSSRE